MVLAVPVGRRRPPWQGVLLTAATFGMYGVYWDYQAHRELYRQFELDHEGRADASVWYILGAPVPLLSLLFPVFPVLRYIHYYTFVGNVAYLRRRMGLPQAISPRRFLVLSLGGLTLLYVTALAAFLALEARGVDILGLGDTADEDATVLGLAILLVLAGAASYVVMRVIAYVQLQGAINEVWDACSFRMHALAGPPTATAAAGSAG